MYVEPTPPSSHMPSLVQEHVLVHMPVPVVGEGEIVGDGGDATAGPRGPQSAQSEPTEQKLYWAPAPPPSQSASEA